MPFLLFVLAIFLMVFGGLAAWYFAGSNKHKATIVSFLVFAIGFIGCFSEVVDVLIA